MITESRGAGGQLLLIQLPEIGAHEPHQVVGVAAELGGECPDRLTEDAGTDGLAGALSPDNLQQITEFRVVSLVFIRAGREKYDDPSEPNYGMPIWYEVTLVNGGQPVRVHESRLIEVPGAPMATTAGVDLRDVPWAGRGLSPKTIQAVQRYELGVKWS